MIASILTRLARGAHRALLGARLAQLQLARAHIAITPPGDHITLMRIDAMVAEVHLHLTLLTAQAEAHR